MKKYSFILLILIGISASVVAQDIKVAGKPEENKETKVQTEMVSKPNTEKKIMVEFSFMANSEAQNYGSNTDSETTTLFGGLILLPLNSKLSLGLSANLINYSYEESDWNQEGSTSSATIMPYIRTVNPLNDYTDIYVDFGIGRQFDLSDDANEDIKNLLITGSINAAFKITDKFFLRTTLVNMNYIKVWLDNENADFSTNVFTFGTMFDGPSIGMLFKF